MEKSETIVADPTCRMGNHMRVSSGDDVLASASWGHTEGLANSQATTLRNFCSAVIPHRMNVVQAEYGCAEPVRRWRRQYLRASSDTCTRNGTPAYGKWHDWRKEGLIHKVGIVPVLLRADAGMPLSQQHLLEQGRAHEVIVPVMTVITNRTREGPLGVRGDCRRGDLGHCPIIQSSGDTGKLSWATQPQSKVEPCRLSEAQSKLQRRKALSDRHTRHLKPDWGNLAVRDFRGDGGNLA